MIGHAVLAVTDGLPPWAQFGVLGLVIAGFLSRLIVPGWLHSDVKAEAADLRAENRALVQQVLETQQRVIPALEEATRAVNAATNEIQVSRMRDRERGDG